MTKQNLSESQFFVPIPANSQVGSLIHLDKEESTHAVKVFRHRVGDSLKIGNGEGVQGIGQITQASTDCCVLALQSIEPITPPSRIHLAIACLKDNDLEEVMESCGQLELASLTLLRTDHSQEPRESDLLRTVRRLELKSMVAFKQSQKAWITRVIGPLPFEQWLPTVSSIMLCDMSGKTCVPDSWKSREHGDLCLAIGPEGGFSNREIDAMMNKGAFRMQLGNTRLRAKTCPAIALGALLGMNVRF